jgi:hypothetical protein
VSRLHVGGAAERIALGRDDRAELAVLVHDIARLGEVGGLRGARSRVERLEAVRVQRRARVGLADHDRDDRAVAAGMEGHQVPAVVQAVASDDAQAAGAALGQFRMHNAAPAGDLVRCGEHLR